MTPTRRLQSYLKGQRPEFYAALETDGIERKLIERAAIGQPINASAHLRLYGLLGIDPMGKGATPVIRVGELFWPSLGAALKIERIQRKLTLRQAASRARMSYSSIGRIERAEAVSIDAVLAACRWLKRHPFDFVSPTVETRSAA